MPTIISAGVGDHPCFLTFYKIPIDYKINSFFLYLYMIQFCRNTIKDSWTCEKFVLFLPVILTERHNSFLGHNKLAYALILIFLIVTI